MNRMLRRALGVRTGDTMTPDEHNRLIESLTWTDDGFPRSAEFDFSALEEDKTWTLYEIEEITTQRQWVWDLEVQVRSPLQVELHGPLDANE